MSNHSIARTDDISSRFCANNQFLKIVLVANIVLWTVKCSLASLCTFDGPLIIAGTCWIARCLCTQFYYVA